MLGSEVQALGKELSYVSPLSPEESALGTKSIYSRDTRQSQF